jgi:anti-sigma-K factor RskA
VSDHDDCRFRDDVGPWVLGALGEPDATAFGAHLEVCAACRREVDELQGVADILPMAAPQQVPPSALKDRIMATVDAEAELLRAAGPEADRPPERDDPSARDRGRARFGWLGRLRPLTAAGLATALLACGGVLGVVLAGGGGSGQDTRTFQGTGAGGARVALEVTGGEHARLELRHMPAPPSGRVYQVWLVTGKAAPRPTHALFTVALDGRASVDIPESVQHADQILVSDEPPGGSPAPTGKVVAGAKLT